MSGEPVPPEPSRTTPDDPVLRAFGAGPPSSVPAQGATQSAPEGLLLGKIALDLQLLQTHQLMDCLKEQEDLRSQGKPVLLQDLLVRRGHLNDEAVARLLTEQQRRTEGLPTLARYEIRDRIGEGATALVYRGWDRELKRLVAVKILRESAGVSEIARQRFRREAQASAGLSHPNVVLVHDAGEKDGRHYLVMELVEGRPFSDVLRSSSTTLEQNLRFLEQAARGVGAAHAKGIVHRDLKPSNILITADGVPKVGDFGLAHLVDSSTELTRTGTALGTPLYMSPEQVEGNPDKITPRTDVYALGAILYELLTGRTPHKGEAIMEIYGKIMREDPPPPRSLNPRVSVDLETIAMKSLEKSAARRYATAEDFAEDLRRCLAGEDILARPLSTTARVWRKAARYRALLIPAAAALLLLAAWASWTTFRNARQVRIELEQATVGESAGNFEGARLAYQAALSIDAGNPTAQAGLTRTSAIVRRLEEARREADRLLETARHDLEAVNRYLYDPNAQYSELLRRVEDRQKLIDDAIAKAPDKALGHYLLARVWEIKGWEDRAEASYRKAIGLEPMLGPAHDQLGRLLLTRAGRTLVGTTPEERTARRLQAQPLIEEASRELAAALKTGSGLDDELRLEIARIMLAYASGSDQEVLRRAEELIQRFPDRDGVEELHWLIGLASSGEAQVEAFSRALAKRPKYPLALLCRAAARIHQGDQEGAIRDCDEALRVSPRLVEAYNNKAVAGLKLGNADLALKSFAQALEIDPRYGPSYENRAALLSSRGDHEGAFADLAKALEINPRSPLALLNRGVVKTRTGDLDGALRDFDSVLSLRPRYPEAFANRGSARTRKGDLEGAIQDFDEALKLEPASAETLNNRGNAWLARGDRFKALEDFSLALAINSRFVEAYYNRGLAHAAGEDTRKADLDFTRAHELRPTWGAPLAARAQIRAFEGDKKGAIKDARKALELGLDEEQRKSMQELLTRLGENL
ncbi:MAG TPA: tetratricopeptide repeat protein [Planctomycetota bacterium]|jgi:serine/threonine-protein kinase|nr:tetratricopeptide repeat protein [Planctomycetota bacterium]